MKPMLYLSPRYTDDAQLLWKAAIKMNWDVQRLSYAILDHLSPSEISERVLYGETVFTSLAAEKLNVKLISPPSRFLYQLDHSLTKRKILHFVYDTSSGFGKSYHNNPHDIDEYETVFWYNLKGPLFVKPVEKGLFPARVYDNPVAEIKNLPNKTEVIVSEPVIWDIEFRAFIMGQKVKTISPYSRKGELVDQASALEWEEGEKFANLVASTCNFAGVVDIGYLQSGGWAVVEANGAWGSGLYGCDPIEALKVIKETCQCL